VFNINPCKSGKWPAPVAAQCHNLARVTPDSPFQFIPPPTGRACARVCACVCVCVFVCMLRAVLLLIYLGSLHVPSCRQRPGLPIAVLQTDWQRCVWPDRPVQDGCVRLVWWYADGVVDDAGHGQAVTVDSQHLGSRCILLSDPGTNGGKWSQYRGVRPQPALCERNRKEALHKHASTT
jgi:hypothetical protein